MGTFRLNPKTKEKFTRGDFNEDGSKRFLSYRTSHVKKDGYFAERWLSKEKFELEVERLSDAQRHRQNENRTSPLPKRINPDTGKHFKPGDMDHDGRYFIGYNSGGKSNGGFRAEKWASKQSWIRARIGLSYYKMRNRAEDKEIPINIDIEYLYSIFPIETMLCPILDIEMSFAGDRSNSPSIDRLQPDLGYVKGNVVWVSMLANIVKRERTPAQLRQIADWIEKQPIYRAYINRSV